MQQVVGGWSRLLRDYIRLQLLSSECGLISTGVPLELGGQLTLLWANLRILLTDGDGHRIALDWNGASSIKPCFRHWNVIGRDDAGRLQHAPSDEYCDITESDTSKFKIWGKADFEQMADTLVAADQGAAGITQTKLKEMRKALGFKITKDSLLACHQLRAHINWQMVCRYDWVHTFLSGGVLTNALWNLVHRAEQVKAATQADVCAFLKQNWMVPMHRRKGGRALWRIFDEHWAASNREHGTVKCSCSELLSLYGLMRYWAMVVLPRASGPDALAALAGPTQSFLLACGCVDIILQAKTQRMPVAQAGDALRRTVSAWMDSHKTHFGVGEIKPKAHWAFDVADQLRVDPMVFDTFVVERMHLRVRAAADHIKHLEGYEDSVLARLTNAQLRTVQCAMPPRRLVGATTSFPGIRSALAADSLEWHGRYASVGDVVRHGDAIGKVVCCAEDNCELFVVCDLYSLGSMCSSRSGTWVSRGARCVWHASETQEVLAWQEVTRGSILVIVA